MTSKEALEGLEILYANALDLTTENTKYLPEYLKPIRDKIKQVLIQAEKDLDVLNILKKYYKNNSGWSNGGIIEFWEMSGAELNKIYKEWLENE